MRAVFSGSAVRYSRSRGCFSTGGERCVRPCCRRSPRGSAPTGVEVLYLYWRRGAIHVLMGHGSQTYRRVLPRYADLCRAGFYAGEVTTMWLALNSEI